MAVQLVIPEIISTNTDTGRAAPAAASSPANRGSRSSVDGGDNRSFKDTLSSVKKSNSTNKNNDNPKSKSSDGGEARGAGMEAAVAAIIKDFDSVKEAVTDGLLLDKLTAAGGGDVSAQQSRFDPDLILGDSTTIGEMEEEADPEQAAGDNRTKMPEGFPEDFAGKAVDKMVSEKGLSSQIVDEVDDGSDLDTAEAAEDLDGEPALKIGGPTDEKLPEKSANPLPEDEVEIENKPLDSADKPLLPPVKAGDKDVAKPADVQTEAADESGDDLVETGAIAAKPASEGQPLREGATDREAESAQRPPTSFTDAPQNQEKNQADSDREDEGNLSARQQPKKTQAGAQKSDTNFDVKNRDDDATASQKGANFAADLAAARAKPDGASEMTPEAGSAGRAGTTYVLNAREVFNDGLNTVIQFMRSDGVTEAHIVVEPPALGRIDITLNPTSAGIDAVFKVDNDNLKQMVSQQIDVLKSSLQAQGIHVSNVTVDIRNRDDQKGRQAAHETRRKSRRVGGAGFEDEEDLTPANMVRLDLEKGLLHWVA